MFMIYSYIIHPFLAQQKKKEITIVDMSFARPDCRDRNLLLRFPSPYLTLNGYSKKVRQYCAVGIRRPSPLFAVLGNFNTAKEGIIATQRAFVSLPPI